jgi:hypothetical protein
MMQELQKRIVRTVEEIAFTSQLFPSSDIQDALKAELRTA